MWHYYLAMIRTALMSICTGMLLALLLVGCSNREVFMAVDHAKCRELGFTSGGEHYDICLSEVKQRRTTLAAAPEPIVETE